VYHILIGTDPISFRVVQCKLIIQSKTTPHYDMVSCTRYTNVAYCSIFVSMEYVYYRAKNVKHTTYGRPIAYRKHIYNAIVGTNVLVTYPKMCFVLTYASVYTKTHLLCIVRVHTHLNWFSYGLYDSSTIT
jgi:hypothetical protein